MRPVADASSGGNLQFSARGAEDWGDAMTTKLHRKIAAIATFATFLNAAFAAAAGTPSTAASREPAGIGAAPDLPQAREVGGDGALAGSNDQLLLFAGDDLGSRGGFTPEPTAQRQVGGGTLVTLRRSPPWALSYFTSPPADEGSVVIDVGSALGPSGWSRLIAVDGDPSGRQSAKLLTFDPSSCAGTAHFESPMASAGEFRTVAVDTSALPGTVMSAPSVTSVITTVASVPEAGAQLTFSFANLATVQVSTTAPATPVRTAGEGPAPGGERGGGIPTRGEPCAPSEQESRGRPPGGHRGGHPPGPLPVGPTEPTTSRRVRLVVLYAQDDWRQLSRLESMLDALRRYQGIEVWWDRQIVAGQEWNPAILREIGRADIALFLASQRSLSRPYIREKELPLALARRAAGELELVVLALEPCACDEDPDLGQLKRLAAQFPSVSEGPSPAIVWNQARKDLVPVIVRVAAEKA
jgi:hypothetical protein